MKSEGLLLAATSVLIAVVLLDLVMRWDHGRQLAVHDQQIVALSSEVQKLLAPQEPVERVAIGFQV